MLSLFFCSRFVFSPAHHVLVFQLLLHSVLARHHTALLRNYFLNCSSIGDPLLFFSIPVVFPKVFVGCKSRHYVSRVSPNESLWQHQNPRKKGSNITTDWFESSKAPDLRSNWLNRTKGVKSSALETYHACSISSATFWEY